MFLLFLVASCQKDEVFEKGGETVSQDKGFVVKTLSGEEIKANEKIVAILQKFKPKPTGNLAGKEGQIHNSEYGFTVYTDVASYIEIDSKGRHSYSFYIEMDNPNDAFMENLLLHSDGKGGYDAFIVHYGFTSGKFKTMTKAELENTNIAYVSINFDHTEVLTGKDTIIIFCLEIQVYDCEPGGCDCDCEWVTVASGCWNAASYNGSGGGNGTLPPLNDGVPEGDWGGGGDGSDGDGDNPPPPEPCHGPDCNLPEITVPVPDPGEDDDPCEQLNELSTSAYLNVAFNNLQNSLDEDEETAYMLTAHPDFPYFQDTEVQNTTETSVPVPLSITLFGVLHNHPIGTEQMFFRGDIYTLYWMSQHFDPGSVPGGPLPATFDYSPVVFMTSTSGYTYAIKVADLAELSGIEDIYNNTKAKRDYLIAFEKMLKSANNQTELEEGFLEFIEEYNLGISLHRASTTDITDYDPAAPHAAVDWENLQLDANGEVNAENCN